MADMPRPVFQLLAETLAAQRVTELFGLIGDANLHMVDAWVRGGTGRYTGCAHEAGAVLAALGHAQVSGGIGVATITHGPALTNAITALAEGAKGGIAMVLLCGDTAPKDREHLQKIDQRELVSASGAGLVEMRTPATAAQDLARAFRRAGLERRPVVFNMRADLQWQETAAPPVTLPIPAIRSAIVENAVFEDALGMIASARRPLILAGRGAIDPEARTAILALARRMQAPMATTLKARGLFHGADFDLGLLGTLGRPVATRVAMQSDCLIALGASLSRLTTDREALVRGKRVVQILADPLENDRRTDHGPLLIADPAAMARRIAEILDEAGLPGTGATDAALLAALQAERAEHAAALPFARTAPGTVDHEPALRQIHRALPETRVLVADLGRFVPGVWRQMPVTDPRHLVYSCNFGGIGCGMAEAIGAARAAGDLPTVLVAGDGGFLLGGLTELSTAARAGLNLLIVICNDGSYGAEHIQFTARGMSPALSMTNPPPFAAIAAAMGIPAHRADSPAALDAACATLAGQEGVRLIELMLDPERIRMD